MAKRGREKTYRYFVGDFETTVYKDQQYTEVWASASVEMFTEDVNIFGSIEEQFSYFVSLDENVCCYYHNLKYDGSFWINYFLKELKLKQALSPDRKFYKDHLMNNNTFKYSISNMGQWYSITVRVNNHFITFRDSLKVLPFSVKRIGQTFDTKHKKLDIDYNGFRYANCPISEKEKEYIANDVFVVKEALEIMFNDNHRELTIGACCIKEFKKLFYDREYYNLFPNLKHFLIDPEIFGSKNADEYVRKSYRGGWCYVVEGKQEKIFKNGLTLDVNSLYSSVMHSQSGNMYPVKKPTFWRGEIPKEAYNNYFFVRLKTRFKIKDGYLPTIQVKRDWKYKSTEYLKTSDFYYNGKWLDKYVDVNGMVQIAKIELTLTCTDYFQLLDHYDLYDTEFLDGCYFQAMCGLFDEYIDKYMFIKMRSKGAVREQAKLFLNNLYGKLATSSNSSYKIAFLKEDGSLGFSTVFEDEKATGYIPCGSAITSYARNFTIKVAQLNYHGETERGFIYADTDSIHCDLSMEEVKGAEIHDSELLKWKLENTWEEAFFTRQKTYIEVDNGNYIVKGAGMPERCKNLFIHSILQDYKEEEYNQEELEFMKTKRAITDFKIGLCVPSKLIPKQIRGGVLLTETTFEMR